ncbi:MAG TPA: xanthine dehydrogenase family protein subunit M [Gammaproteobacteria bacterium]|nr:xanthine dehydrogenase family protein subunit M [Gammaproteobacteria bacterium]
MIPGRFEYHAPASVDEAIALLGQYGDDAKLLAGGHSLLPMMKLRFAEFEHLIDINRIDELRGIREEKGWLRIGAMTTENDLLASDLLREKCPLIPQATEWIADPQVRNCGTIGGDVAHGDPGNDHPAVMLALEAEMVLQGPDGERTVPADGFFLGTYFTEIGEDEILTAIRVPVGPPGSGSAYCKLKRKTGDFATAAAAVCLQMDGDTCRKAGIGLTNVGQTALKAADAEKVLSGRKIDEALIEQAAQAAMAICDPAEDLRGDREYKTAMAGEMTRRAIRQALARARG